MSDRNINKFRKAIEGEDWANIKKCIKNGLNIDKSYTYRTADKSKDCEFIPLIYAVENQKIKVVEYFLEKAADITLIKLKNGETALSTAVKKGNVEIVKLLMEKGTNPNIQTALLVAIENKKIDVVKYLVEGGADVLQKLDDNGETAFTTAAKIGNLEIVKLLIEKGAKPNIQTALLVAIKNKKLDIAKYMVERGADVLQKLDNGETALSTAAKIGHLEMVNFLMKNGAKPTIQKAFLGAIEKRKLDIVKYMVDVDKEKRIVNWKYKDGDTPLLKSLTMKYEEIAKFLIDEGASLEEFELNGVKYAPLFYSLEHQLFDVFKHLVKKKGVDVNQKDNNEKTALAIAASKEYFSCVVCLIESGADIKLAQKEIDAYAEKDEEFYYYLKLKKLDANAASAAINSETAKNNK